MKFHHEQEGSQQAYRVEIGPHEFFFSYATLIAYRAPGIYIRTAEHFSRTTSKHVRSLGVEGFDVLEPALFAAGVEEALARSGVKV